MQFAPHARGYFGGFYGGHKCKSGKAAKRLSRLAPNLVYVCGLIWECTEAKNNSPTIPQGGIGGGGGGGLAVNNCKDWEMWYKGLTRPSGNKFSTYNVDESGNGHRLNKWSHETPGGAF